MGIVYQALKAEHGGFDIQDFIKVRCASFELVKRMSDTVLKLIHGAAKNKDSALFSSIASSLADDISTFSDEYEKMTDAIFLDYLNTLKGTGQDAAFINYRETFEKGLGKVNDFKDAPLSKCLLDRIKQSLLPYEIHYRQKDLSAYFTLSSEQIRTLASSIDLTAKDAGMLCFIEAEYYITDLHPIFNLNQHLTHKDIMTYFALGMHLTGEDLGEDYVVLHQRLPDEVVGHPIFNGLRKMQIGTYDDIDYEYEHRRLECYKKQFGEHYQVALALEELIHHDFVDHVIAMANRVDDYPALIDWALSFNISEIKNDAIEVDSFEGQLDGIIRNPPDLNRTDKSYMSGKSGLDSVGRMRQLLECIKERRQAFMELDKRINCIAARGGPSEHLALFESVLESIKQAAKYNGQRPVIAVITDDMPMPALCNLVHKVIQLYAQEQQEHVLRDIAMHFPIAAWQYLAENELLNNDQVSALVNAVCKRPWISSNYPAYFEKISNFAFACEAAFPGSIKAFLNVYPVQFPDEFTSNLVLHINREKNLDFSNFEQSAAEVSFLNGADLRI